MGVIVTTGDQTYIDRSVKFIGDGEIVIGDYCKIHNNVTIIVSENKFTIGHNCWIGQNAVIDGTGGIYIGNNVGIGIGCSLWTHAMLGDPLEGCRYHCKKSLHIEDDVWFMSNCQVASIRAESKSIAMMGSIVHKNMLYNHVYAGNPAIDITNRTGCAYNTISIKEKFEIFESKKYVFCSRNQCDDSQIVTVENFDQVDLTNKITYFNISNRKYTKKSTKIEQDFMKYLITQKIKFTPM